jgi:hypothetical protein
MRKSSNREIPQALATYLFWLKTGLDYRTILTIFSIDSNQKVGEYCDQVRTALMKDFVPNNLGASHISREQWLQQNSLIPKELFNVGNNELMVIADGTYLYCHKSKYNNLQRKQYSMQKHRNLVKPFVVCTTNGKIIDTFGFFPATQNDATILDTILKSNEKHCKEFSSLLQPNDHIIVDRGFRESIPMLQNSYKLKTHMPCCIPTKQKQLTAFEANSTRYVTKSRCVVESINAQLKTRFRANDKVHLNVTLPHAMDDLRISGALLNRFSTQYVSDKGNEQTILSNMKSRLHNINKLKTLFLEHHIDKKRTAYTRLNSESVPDFPKLSNNAIINGLACGTYQLKQSLGYIHENFDDSGNNYIELYADKTNMFEPGLYLLRSRIQSRHSNNTKYNSYVTYSTNKDDDNPIKNWYCTCKNGRRTISCCSHVTGVVYYLSNGRFSTRKTGKFTIDKIFPGHATRESSEDSDTTDIDDS